jgi:hypothetical protein
LTDGITSGSAGIIDGHNIVQTPEGFKKPKVIKSFTFELSGAACLCPLLERLVSGIYWYVSLNLFNSSVSQVELSTGPESPHLTR